MNTAEIVRILENIAAMLELKGENQFKARAYTNAAQVIISEGIDVEKAVREDTLKDVSGFGEALLKKVSEYVLTGKMEYYEKLQQEVPPGLLEMTKLGGIGPKKVKRIYDELGITTVSELEDACRADMIAHLKGFGEKTQETILNSIEHRKASRGRHLQQKALAAADNILSILNSTPLVKRAEITASVRRRCETISELYFITAADKKEDIKEAGNWMLDLKESNGLYKSETFGGIPLVVEHSLPEDFVWRLHESTGSAAYLEAFLDHARAEGYETDFDGIYMADTKIQLNDEKDLYDLLDMQYVPPELRETPEAIAKAKERTIPELITVKDMKGMLHVHSNWSDGRNTIREMALKAKELGYEYIAMCDHSRAAAYAGGLSIDDVSRQHEEIDKLNEENLGIKILKGIESDILPDGSLDYPDNVLEQFDLIVASVHSSFKMPKDEMTKRILRALENPFTTIIGHPTGRLLLAREAYEVDIIQLIDAAIESGKVIEINANPYRLDLSWENAKYACGKGMKTAINPDSHETGTLTDVNFGINIARKAWLTRNDVINCLSFEDFRKNVMRKKG